MTELTSEIVRKNKVHEQVAQRIERMIAEQLKPGDKLPPERQLAERFGVGRSSIRDAIHTLQMIGLLEARQGMGTVVCEPSADKLVNPLAAVLLRQRQLVTELLEVRLLLEPALAARAALNATPEQVAAIEDVLERQEVKVRRGELAIEEDSEFHYRIARAAGNSVVLRMLDFLMDLLRQTRERTLQVEGRRQKSFAGHRRIVAALRAHDPEAAQEAMRRHLGEIERIVYTTLEHRQVEIARTGKSTPAKRNGRKKNN